MDSKADERDDAEHALLARYHAQAPAPPPAALDAQIRAAAHEAVASAGGQRDDAQPPASGEGYARPSPWIALAAAVAMVAVVLPGLLNEPDTGVPVLEGGMDEAEVATVQSAPAPLALGGATVVEQDAAPAEMEVPRVTAKSYSLRARNESDAIAIDGPLEVFARRERVGTGAVREERQALAPASGAADEQAPAMELVTHHRLEGRFRPDAVTPDQLNVTLLESLVLIQGDWAPEEAACEPLLTLERRRGESARVSVEHIAGSSADDFVFLRLESSSRVRLVHCTAQGWVISAR